jgi:hypothetical protein
MLPIDIAMVSSKELLKAVLLATVWYLRERVERKATG